MTTFARAGSTNPPNPGKIGFMPGMRIGILHPGQMGLVVAASARNGGNEALWASQGRSPRTSERARQAGLIDAGSVAELCRVCEVVISVCLPEFAEDVADQVLREGFRGIYVDANAIALGRA